MTILSTILNLALSNIIFHGREKQMYTNNQILTNLNLNHVEELLWDAASFYSWGPLIMIWSDENYIMYILLASLTIIFDSNEEVAFNVKVYFSLLFKPHRWRNG